MKKQLPNKGFTLLELLVVVSIMAVLAVITFSIFGNVQKNARDGRRRVEVDTISKSIESARNVTSASYTYAATQFTNDFGATDPKDPLGWPYCFAVGSSTTPPNDPLATWAPTVAAPCPTGAAANGSTWYTFTQAVVGGATPPINVVPSWKVCSKLEASLVVFCKFSILR